MVLCISTHLAALHSFILACLLTSLLLRKEKKRTGTKASAFVSYQVFLMGGIKRVKIVSLTDHQACQKMDFTYLKGGFFLKSFSFLIVCNL